MPREILTMLRPVRCHNKDEQPIPRQTDLSQTDTVKAQSEQRRVRTRHSSTATKERENVCVKEELCHNANDHDIELKTTTESSDKEETKRFQKATSSQTMPKDPVAQKSRSNQAPSVRRPSESTTCLFQSIMRCDVDSRVSR